MLEYVLGGILILVSIFLVVAVLLQSGKGKKGLSGAIAGGDNTFFGKNQTTKKEQILSKATTIVAIVFAVAVVVAFVFQNRFDTPIADNSGAGTTQVENAEDEHDHNHESTETDAADETDVADAE